MLVRCLTSPSLSFNCRSRLFLPSVLERCNTSGNPSGTSWGRYKDRHGPAEFAFGRRRLLFGGWNDRIYCELSPPPRLLLRKCMPPLSVQGITTEPARPRDQHQQKCLRMAFRAPGALVRGSVNFRFGPSALFCAIGPHLQFAFRYEKNVDKVS